MSISFNYLPSFSARLSITGGNGSLSNCVLEVEVVARQARRPVLAFLAVRNLTAELLLKLLSGDERENYVVGRARSDLHLLQRGRGQEPADRLEDQVERRDGIEDVHAARSSSLDLRDSRHHVLHESPLHVEQRQALLVLDADDVLDRAIVEHVIAHEVVLEETHSDTLFRRRQRAEAKHARRCDHQVRSELSVATSNIDEA